jgi:hypothetical protein
MRHIPLKIFIMTCLLTGSAIAHAATWKTASWGKAWVTVGQVEGEGDDDHNLTRMFNGQIDDTLTDGYCVYVRYRITGQRWPAESLRDFYKSCGPVTSFGWAPTFPGGKNLGGIRLYRDDGRYLTLWGS